MKQKMIIKEHFDDREHESALEEIKRCLLVSVALQGKQDGSCCAPKTPNEYQARILNHIENTVQAAINLNQQKYLPISGIAQAKLIEAEANKKEQELQNAIHDNEHLLLNKVHEVKQLQCDVKHIRMRKLVVACLVFISISEGITSYPALRHYGFSVLLSVIAGVGIVGAVGLSAHYLGGYIKNATNMLSRWFRYAVSLIPAVVGFTMLGYLRARVVDTAYNLHIDTPSVSNHTTHYLSAAAISTLSILLYWIALFLSSLFFPSKAERMQETSFETLSMEIENLQNDIKEKEGEIKRTRDEKLAKMSLALQMFEYALYVENHLINFAQEAAEAYKQKNLRHRSDGCPAFFCHKPVFHFTTFFQTVKTQQQYETIH